MRLVVTGCGGSGTAFVAAVLFRCGIRVGHEQVFTNTVVDWKDYEADVSWPAVSHLPFEDDVFVVHLIRNPLHVARSMVVFFDTEGEIGDHLPEWAAQRDVVRRCAPEVFREPTPIRRFVRYYQIWNAHAASVADGTIMIERITANDVVRLCAVVDHDVEDWAAQAALDAVPTDFNRHLQRDDSLSWSDIPELMKFARRHGYELPEEPS